jgi:hypothetical protein
MAGAASVDLLRGQRDICKNGHFIVHGIINPDAKLRSTPTFQLEWLAQTSLSTISFAISSQMDLQTFRQIPCSLFFEAGDPAGVAQAVESSYSLADSGAVEAEDHWVACPEVDDSLAVLQTDPGSETFRGAWEETEIPCGSLALAFCPAAPGVEGAPGHRTYLEEGVADLGRTGGIQKLSEAAVLCLEAVAGSVFPRKDQTVPDCSATSEVTLSATRDVPSVVEEAKDLSPAAAVVEAVFAVPCRSYRLLQRSCVLAAALSTVVYRRRATDPMTQMRPGAAGDVVVAAVGKENAIDCGLKSVGYAVKATESDFSLVAADPFFELEGVKRPLAAVFSCPRTWNEAWSRI